MTFEAIMKRAVIGATVELSLRGIKEDPKRSMKNAVDLFSYLSKDIFGEHIMSKIYREAENPKSCFYKMVTSMVQNVDHSILKTVGTNMCFNRVAVMTDSKQIKGRKNRCKRLINSGCPLPEAVRLAKEEGIYFFILCGDSPLRHCDEILETCRRNKDCVFYLAADEHNISESFAGKVHDAGNIILAVRINTHAQPEKITEECRPAFQLLKKKKCLFGYIAEAGSLTAKTCYSSGFLHCMASFGCLFGWYYIPRGDRTSISCRTALNQLMQSALISRSKPLMLLSPQTDRIILKKFVTGGRCYCVFSKDSMRCLFSLQKNSQANGAQKFP